ncbi:MAG: hypothetical protein WBX49_09135 [Candidatus Deferrimicrobiaceae bacterium]
MKGRGSEISLLLEALRSRGLDSGGFSNRPGEEFRADATAWAAMALTATGTDEGLLGEARDRLAGEQQEDGRVSVSSEHPEAFWPTPLAVLAWEGSPAHREAQSRAIAFLKKTTGRHFVKDPEAPVKHDTSVKGWPWITGSHSMVEPTALSLIALQTAGQGENGRTREAIRMLMDRQLTAGGWNYGNTSVYGQELYPQPENTGLALDALAGRVLRNDVARSLGYLEDRLTHVRAPLSLGWGLLGLGAWEARPGNARRWLRESFELQRKYGPYDTTLLSLLLLAFLATGGLGSVVGRQGTR